MKYVLPHESREVADAKVREHFAEHRALRERFRAEGTLLLIGPFADR